MDSEEEEEERLLQNPVETSNGGSSAAISNMFEDSSIEMGSEISRARSLSQGFVPINVELSTFATLDAAFEMSGALERCKKTVLNPYHYFLKTIGWRAFRSVNHDLSQPLSRQILNVVYPIVIVVLLLISCLTQILTCFRRDWGKFIEKNCSDVTNTSTQSTVIHLSCEEHVLTVFIIPDILLVSAYAYGIYVFRFKHPEYLSTLMETTFLGYCVKHGRYRPNNLIRSLRILMAVGVLWVLLSLGISAMRVKGLHLLNDSTYINWIPPSGGGLHDINNHRIERSCVPSDLTVRWVLVILTLFGFVVFDLAYIATVINYACQCHLLTCLILGLKERILMKAWDVDEAIKGIKPAQDFLRRLNGHLAAATSIVMFIFITSLVATVVGATRQKHHHHHTYGEVVIALSILQWVSIFLLPVYQATKLTRACQRLKRLGHEIRTRPFTYHNVKQLDLDSFLSYISSLDISAKLVMVPMYPSLVAGTLFITFVIIVCIFSSQRTSGEFFASWL